MKSQALAFMADSSLLALPLAALLLFFGLFLVVVSRLIWRGASAYDSIAQLPLESTSAAPGDATDADANHGGV